MSFLTRRDFGALALLAGTSGRSLAASGTLDETLHAGVKRHAIPFAAAMVAGPEKTIYEGGAGNVTADSIFRIASMTKPVTATATMQLVEQGKVSLDQPVVRYLPQFAKLQVLEGFHPQTGEPQLRPAREPLLVRHLLTHTSGLVYDNWDADLLRYLARTPSADPGAVPPLMFEPGTRWEYGTGMDWAGRLVETVSGQTLEDYFQRNILRPLGMEDTSFILPETKFPRLVSVWQRQPDGVLKESPFTPPVPPKSFNGGGGLFSTPRDYTRFMQMFLRRGQQVLQPRTVTLMTSNQTGPLSAGKLKTQRPETSSDVDFHPGFTDSFGFGFLINPKPYAGGRSAGSLAWAGIRNTFFWIDPHRALCAVLMLQFLPFCDREAIALLHEFEQAVYASA